MKKIMLILISLMLTTTAYSHEESKTKLVFGKKCVVNKNDNTIVSSYVWVVEKKSDWQKEINKKNCKE